MPSTTIGPSGVTFPDGSTQAKAAAGFSGATINSSSASALTLTSASEQFQVFRPTSQANAVVNLPAANTLTRGYPPFVVFNQSPVAASVQVKDSTGTVVGYVSPGSTGVFALADNSTAAGVWSCTIGSPQALVNVNDASYTVTSLTGYTTGLTVCPLTATTFVELWCNSVNAAPSSNYYINIYYRIGTVSGNSISYGTTSSINIATVDSSNQSVSISAQRLSDTSFVVCSKRGGTWVSSYYQCCWGYNYTTNADNNTQFRVATVSGATVTWGSAYTYASYSASASGVNASWAPGGRNGQWAVLSSTSVAVVGNNGFALGNTTQPFTGSLSCTILSISGTTITAGTAVALASSTYGVPNAVCPVSSTQFVVSYGQASAANSRAGRTKFVSVSVSGTVPTWGSPVTLESLDAAYAVNQLYTDPSTSGGAATSSTQMVMRYGYGVAYISLSGGTPVVDASTPTSQVEASRYFLVGSGRVFDGSRYYTAVTGGYVRSQPAATILSPATAAGASVFCQVGQVAPLTAVSSFVGYTSNDATLTRVLMNTI